MTEATVGEVARQLALAQRRRQRLEQLLSLALAYRVCTRKELARTLGRDPTKLVPGTGIPKLDFVVELAAVLEWSVGDVVGHLADDPLPALNGNGSGLAALANGALRRPQAGDEPSAARKARAEFAAAHSPAERAAACRAEAGAWSRMGRYQEAVAAATRGLGQPRVAPEARRALQVLLADAYYALWSLVEARAIAADLVESYRRRPPRAAEERRHQARAHYLLGQAYRRSLDIERQRQAHAALARRQLEQALVHYRQLALEDGDRGAEGTADTIAGALLEIDVLLRRRRPESALDQLCLGLERVRDVTAVCNERLESYGWWCIYGCNIALRHCRDEALLHQHMAVFTNKADEIANLLDNWSMRERVFTMQYTRWERAAQSTCFEIPRIIDSDDVRVIAGTMGRFPTFRETGWRILQTAQFVDG